MGLPIISALDGNFNGKGELLLDKMRKLVATTINEIDVGNVAEAEQFCQEGLPHALLFDAALMNEQLLQLIAGVMRDAPDFLP
jgi:hypothetical protein